MSFENLSPEQIQIGALIALGVVVLLIAIWLFMRANRKTTIVGDESSGKDVLDEGSAKASRNQALIDSPRTVETEAPNVPAPEPAPVATSTPEPATTPAPPPTQTAGDDLRKIKGLGPKLVTLLAEQGITSFAQIAAWSDADVERIDATLGRFSGRITRDQWVEQAKLLTDGKEDTFSEKFGQK